MQAFTTRLSSLEPLSEGFNSWVHAGSGNNMQETSPQVKANKVRIETAINETEDN